MKLATSQPPTDSISSAPRITPVNTPVRVLVVDDDREVREALADVLRANGYDALEAENGAHALAILERGEPLDLILLDLNMPEPDGFAILRKLNAREGTRDLPVICLSARSAVEDRVQGLNLGAVDYLAKPFDLQELFARMARAVRVKRTLERLSHAKTRAEHLSLTDPLTGLPNRRDLEQRLRSEIERSRRQDEPLGCLVIDVDHFKQINDRFGHGVGDMVLVEVGRTLRGSLRPFDTVARFGGDEFVVLLPGASLDGASEVAGTLRRIVAALELTTERGERIPLALSIGVASRASNSEELGAQLLERADAALLEAKRAGRDRVVTRA